MDFRQFRYFVTAAEELHFARAAEKLGIAQPALSQQIKSLEEQLGTRLFHRTKRRVDLTETGIVFLQEARATLAQAGKAIRIVQSMARGESGQIDIGFVGSVVYETRFMQQLSTYSKKHPGVQISLHEMPVQTQIDALHARQLDIAIIRDPVSTNTLDDTEYFTLSTQRLLLVLPEKHPLSTKTAIKLAELAQDAFLAFGDPAGVGIGQALLDHCRKAGFEPRISQRVSDITTLISLVAARFGVSLVPESVRHLRLPGVCYRPLKDAEAPSNLIVIHRRFEPSVAVNALLNTLRKTTRAATTEVTSRKQRPSSK